MAEENVLKKGASFFHFVGRVSADPTKFEGLKPAQKTGGWRAVRDVVTLTIGEGTKVFPVIQDGLMESNPVINKFMKAGQGEMVKIPFTERFNYLDKVVGNYRIGIERDESGRIITKEFIHGADVSEYLKEHLKSGMEVSVSGSVRYNYYNESVRREYHIGSIFLNEGGMRNGEKIEPQEHEAVVTQTYLVNNDSFSKKFEKELSEEGRTVLNVFVPEYVSKLHLGDKNYAEVKATLALPEQIVFLANDEDGYKRSLGYLKLLKSKIGRNKAIRVGLKNTVYDGAQTEVKDMEVTPEIQMLIDAGVLPQSELESQLRVKQGSSISEIIFNVPRIITGNDGTMQQDLEDIDNDLLVFNPEQYAGNVSTDTSDNGMSKSDAVEIEDMFGSSIKPEEKKEDDPFSNFFNIEDDDLPFN